MTLTKHGIVDCIQNELGYQRNESVELNETLLEIIKSTLEAGEDAILPARRVVTFKCSGKLRDKINGK